jgi:hypothetical protein
MTTIRRPAASARGDSAAQRPFRVGLLAVVLGLLILLFTAPNALGVEIQFRHAKHHAALRIRMAENCDEGSTFAKVFFALKGQRHVLWTPDVCKVEWREARVPRLTTLAWSFRGEDEVTGEPASTAESNIEIGFDWSESGGVIPRTKYRVTVVTRDQRVSRRLLAEASRNGHYERVYEGTDAFVNYCIDRSKEIRSANGRLFCVRWIPSTGRELLRWTR